MENSSYQIPEQLRPSRSGTDRLFTSRLLEKLTRTPISFAVTIHLLVIIGDVVLCIATA